MAFHVPLHAAFANGRSYSAGVLLLFRSIEPERGPNPVYLTAIPRLGSTRAFRVGDGPWDSHARRGSNGPRHSASLP